MNGGEKLMFPPWQPGFGLERLAGTHYPPHAYTSPIGASTAVATSTAGSSRAAVAPYHLEVFHGLLWRGLPFPPAATPRQNTSLFTAGARPATRSGGVADVRPRRDSAQEDRIGGGRRSVRLLRMPPITLSLPKPPQGRRYRRIRYTASRHTRRKGGTGAASTLTGGQQPVWEVPADVHGMKRDLEMLESEWLALRDQLDKSSWSHLKLKSSYSFDIDRYDAEIRVFSLSPEDPHQLPPRELLLEPKLTSVVEAKTATPCEVYSEYLRAPSSTRWDASQWSQSSTCNNIRSAQTRRLITLKLRDLCTLLPDRWCNSVVINAYLHWIVECYPQKETLYLNSAQEDIDLQELKNTPRCYTQILSALFRDSHWTVLWIDHDRQEIWHLNSDVNQMRVPQEQIAPFRKLFPGYRYFIIPCVKQCDNSSCGIYVCYWAWCFMFRRNALLSITCPDIRRFRQIVLRQVLLAYCALRSWR